MPPINCFGILWRVGIFHGPTSCQPETVLTEEGTRQNVLNPENSQTPEAPEPLKPLKLSSPLTPKKKTKKT